MTRGHKPSQASSQPRGDADSLAARRRGAERGVGIGRGSQRKRMGGGLEVAVVEDAAAGSAAEGPAAAAANGEEGMRMEGWLYLIRSNRFGLQYSRKRYFVLEDAALRCFKSAPSSKREVTNTRTPPVPSRCSCVGFLSFFLLVFPSFFFRCVAPTGIGMLNNSDEKLISFVITRPLG